MALENKSLPLVTYREQLAHIGIPNQQAIDRLLDEKFIPFGQQIIDKIITDIPSLQSAVEGDLSEHPFLALPQAATVYVDRSVVIPSGVRAAHEARYDPSAFAFWYDIHQGARAIVRRTGLAGYGIGWGEQPAIEEVRSRYGDLDIASVIDGANTYIVWQAETASAIRDLVDDNYIGEALVGRHIDTLSKGPDHPMRPQYYDRNSVPQLVLTGAYLAGGLYTTVTSMVATEAVKLAA